jgi:hypothetical protein
MPPVAITCTLPVTVGVIVARLPRPIIRKLVVALPTGLEEPESTAAGVIAAPAVTFPEASVCNVPAV